MASLASLLCHFFQHHPSWKQCLKYYIISFGFSIKERVASIGPPILWCLADLGHHINVTLTMHCQKRVWALINFENADVSELLITQIQIFVSIQSLLKSIGNISYLYRKGGVAGDSIRDKLFLCHLNKSWKTSHKPIPLLRWKHVNRYYLIVKISRSARCFTSIPKGTSLGTSWFGSYNRWMMPFLMAVLQVRSYWKLHLYVYCWSFMNHMNELDLLAFCWSRQVHFWSHSKNHRVWKNILV